MYSKFVECINNFNWNS